MRFSQTTAALAMLSSAFAAPIEERQPAQQGSDAAYTIKQVLVNENPHRNGAAAVAKAMRKYGIEVPSHVQAAAAAASSGSVTATPEANDAEYLCPVQIGTPAQTLMLDFDTGSSDLWVFSSRLPANERSGHSIYTPGSSSTSRLESGETWDIMYEDGSGSSGVVYADKVVIGGVTATSQGVEAATSVSAQFVQDTQNDGLVGLGFDNINTATPTKQQTFFGNVMSSLSQPLFAAYLKHNAAGAYDFGFTNSAHYSGTIGYTSVSSSRGVWQFTAGTYYVGGTAKGTLGSAICDTGTSIILTNTQAEAANYWNQVSGASYSNTYGGYVFPCNANLPTYSISIAGAQRTVPGSYMNYATISGNTCYGAIQYSGGGIGFTILGDTFIKSQYVVFNYNGGSPEIGFATQR